MKREYLENRIQQAISLVKVNLPMMVPLIVQVRISLDMRVDTACVFPSGRMLVSPFFIAPMSTLQLAYLIAHEVMHLYLKTAERGEAFPNDHKIVNIAHDFIINHKLSKVFGIDPPCGGLNWDPFAKAVFFDNCEGEYRLFPSLFKPLDATPLETLVIDLKAFIEYEKPQLKYSNESKPTPKAKEAKSSEKQPTNTSSPWDVLDQLNLPPPKVDEEQLEKSKQETIEINNPETEEPSSPQSSSTQPAENTSLIQNPPSQSADGTVPDEIDLTDEKNLELQQRMQNKDEIQKVLDLLLDDVRTEEDELVMFPNMSPSELKGLINDINKG
ncbi:MAG: hypothetical protein IKR81_08110, partial [Victivallales bacterium]|nr:hypothetical protein [Victivallales bacterium]